MKVHCLSLNLWSVYSASEAQVLLSILIWVDDYEAPTPIYLALSLLTKVNSQLKAESKEGMKTQPVVIRVLVTLGMGSCKKRVVPLEYSVLCSDMQLIPL